MAIEVEGPDGSVVEFPDGTANEAIKGAMAKHFGSPTPKAEPTPEQNQQSTEAMPWYTKTAKALAYGAAAIRTKDANTLRKSGALGINPDNIDKNTEGLKQFAGIENYDPASAHFADSSKPWTERIGYMPRALLEGTPEMAQHIAASTVAGPLGMLGSTAISRGGDAVDAVRQADKTEPNAELTPSQKLRVGGDVAIQSLLNEIGGRATLGATKPVTGVGLQAVKQAGSNVAKAAVTDAAVGAYGAGVDKTLLEGKEPTVADIALPGLAGAAVGTAFRTPGAIRDAAVATRFRSLGSLDPQSRGNVAGILKEHEGSFKATNERLDKELTLASKGLDEVTKDNINNAKIKLDNKQRLTSDEINEITKASPEAGRALQDLDTFTVMQSLDNGGMSGTFLGRILNPYQRAAHSDPATTLGKFTEGAAVGHGLWTKDPYTTAAILGTKLVGSAGLKGLDAITGASNPSKVIIDKFAGTANPRQTIAQARQDLFAQNLAERQNKAAADRFEANAAKGEHQLEKDKLNLRDIADRNTKAEDTAAKKASDNLYKTARYLLGIRSRSDIPVSEAMGRSLGESQNVPLQELVSSDATGSIKINKAAQQISQAAQAAQDIAMARQASIMRNSQATEQARQNQLLSNVGQQNRIRIASEAQPYSETVSDPGVFRANQGLAKAEAAKAAAAEAAAANAEPQGPPEFQWGSSSELAGTQTLKNMQTASALARHNKRQEAEQTKADKKTKAEQKKADDALLAKVAGKAKNAESKAESSTKEADKNLFIINHRGQKVVRDLTTGNIDNPSAYERSTKERIDKRMDVIDKAKSMTTDKDVKKTLDTLAYNWSSFSSKGVDQAYSHAEKAWNDSKMPKDVQEYLKDNFRHILGTFEQ